MVDRTGKKIDCAGKLKAQITKLMTFNEKHDKKTSSQDPLLS